jgi:S-adenosylmethionine-diacylglycerol 3-amino-3-carboxypropyl transferase
MMRLPILNRARDSVFGHIHGNNLIYNQCWEDPRLDRAVMDLDADSTVVMITSAGCNALDYLIDAPSHIFAIDVNPRQNALLELKRQMFRFGNHAFLFDCFGQGYSSDFDTIYKGSLRKSLPEFAQYFWDTHLHYLNGTSKKQSFFFHGTSGTFAWMMSHYLNRNPDRKKAVHELLESQTLEEQVYWYDQIEEYIWNSFSTWFIDRHVVLALLGVPRQQRDLIQEQYPGGVSRFVRDKLRHVFTRLHISDNYFWRVYLTGAYTSSCCPEYLKSQHFGALRNSIDRISTHTTTLSSFLIDNPGSYSHYVLLDHQDWLASHDPVALQEEWDLILKNSSKGTTILLRSASMEVNFLPPSVHEAVEFDISAAAKLHDLDRVGTYGSFYIGQVK